MKHISKLKKSGGDSWAGYFSRLRHAVWWRVRRVSTLKKNAGETWAGYFSRLRYTVLRNVHPTYREHYRLEQLVGPENCWDELVQYQFNILTAVGVKPQHALLDLGCGPLTVGLKLIPYLDRGNYVGVDLRVQPLNEAHRLVAKHSLAHKNPTLLNSQSFGQEEIGSRKFDFIWMSQLSYHLDAGQMDGLFEQAQARLKPDGTLAFDIMDPGWAFHPGANWSGFSFHIRPVGFYEALGRRFGFSMTCRGRIVEFGYPKRIDLHTNILLTFSKSPELGEKS